MLGELEGEGWHIVPSAKAVQLTMNRDGIRDFAAKELGLTTSRYCFAETPRRGDRCGGDASACPAWSSRSCRRSGKGQSVATTEEELGTRFDYAVANMRGDRPRVIVEEFIDFD